jgi:hypothetical protein
MAKKRIKGDENGNRVLANRNKNAYSQFSESARFRLHPSQEPSWSICLRS